MGRNAEVAVKRGNKFLDVLHAVPLNINQLQIQGNGETEALVNFYRDGYTTLGYGQFFVSMPKELSNRVLSTYISPPRFLETLKDVDQSDRNELERIQRSLMGDNTFDGYLVLDYQEDNFSLSVFHGLTNPHALTIAELGTNLSLFRLQPIERDLHKLNYQDNLAKIVQPILQKPINSENPPAMWIVEDSLATASSIIAALSALQQKTTLNEMSRVRVDVAVASAQGILTLKKFVQQNGINLELNVGFMGFGLNLGKETPGKGRENSAYIHYPAKLLEDLDEMFLFTSFRQILRGKLAVGNMSVVGQLDNGNEEIVSPWLKEIAGPVLREGQYPLVVFLANEGGLMRSFFHHFVDCKSDELPELTLETKRLYDEGIDGRPPYGYGVLVGNIPEQILI